MDDEYSFDFDSPESWADYDLTYNPDTHIATGTEDDPYSGYIFEGPVQYRPVEITDPEATGYRQFVDPNDPNNVVTVDPFGKIYSGNTLVYTPPPAGGSLDAFGKALQNFLFKDGKLNVGNIAKAGAGIAAMRTIAGSGFGSPPTVGGPLGSTKPVPPLTAVRAQVPSEYDPHRRPGAGGRQYFTAPKYVAPAGATAAREAAQTEAKGIAALAKPKAATPAAAATVPAATEQATSTDQPASKVIDLKPVSTATLAHGGVAALAQGRYLNGSSDGMADKIPANIEGKQPARLSHGEFVIPADVVSHLGNGNSEAGAQRLYDMMDKIRRARTGNSKQGKQINPDKFLPTRG